MPNHPIATILFSAGLGVLVAGSARGEAPAAVPVAPLAAEFRIDPEDPESSVPSVALRNAKPLEFGYFLQDLATSAESATKQGDHLAAVRFYRAFTKAVPDSTAGFVKLCQALESAQRLEEAITACRAVLGLTGVTLADYVRFVRLVLGKNSPLSKEEREDITQITRHLRDDPATRMAAGQLDCELALRVGDLALLKSCTAALEVLAATDPKTIAFAWALAVREGDQDRARSLIARARVSGVTAEGITRMEQATVARTPFWRKLVDWKFGLLLFAAVAAAAVALNFSRQRFTSRRSA